MSFTKRPGFFKAIIYLWLCGCLRVCNQEASGAVNSNQPITRSRERELLLVLLLLKNLEISRTQNLATRNNNMKPEGEKKT